MDRDALTAAFQRATNAAAAAPWRVERRVESLLRPDVPTFAEAPRIALDEATGNDAVVYGIPFEGLVVKDPRTFYPQGTAPPPGASRYSRPGAYGAPDAIRQASLFFSLDHSGGSMPELDLSLASQLRIADAGDADVGDQPPERLLDWIPGELERIVSAGAVPIVLGGDHLVPIFPLTAIQRARGGRVGVITYDAHHDLSWEPAYWAGSQWARAMEIGVLEPRNLVQIGIRGLRNSLAWRAAANELGIRAFTMADVDRDGIDAVTRAALEVALDGVDALYVSVDVDAFDPAAVPGQKYPEPGGLTTREMISSLRTVCAAAPEIAGYDFCCYSPSYDCQGAGAAAAARCAVEVLAGLARRTRPESPP